MTASDIIQPSKTPVPGWVGGFEASDAKFAYPEPDLSDLPLLGNMDNIGELQRELDILWPEFSWLTVMGDAFSRCYSMFAPDISRVGYDATGRVWSIICPQQGFYSPTLGDLNVEVTVTGQRGWVDETVADRNYDLIAADMTVEAKIWFGPAAKDKLIYKILSLVLASRKLPFPYDKAHAIRLTLLRVGSSTEGILPVRSGVASGFENPGFALHGDVAWAVGNVEVQIGGIQTTGDAMVDDFNALVLDVFNLASGNMLRQGNILTWNVWFDAPTRVDREEWVEHAIKWRDAIDTGHVTPDGPGHPARYFNGTPFKAIDAVVQAEEDKILDWVRKHVV